MKRALVIGASGGIGTAISSELSARDYEVMGLSRSRDGLDVTNEASVEADLGALDAPFALIFVATTGELGRRYRDSASAFPTLHSQFNNIMSTLSGTLDRTKLANAPVAYGRTWDGSEWLANSYRALRASMLIMSSAYTLQAVIQGIIRLVGRARRKHAGAGAKQKDGSSALTTTVTDPSLPVAASA